MQTDDSMINMTQNFFAPDILQKISEIIGQPVENTKKGLSKIIPTFMIEMLDKGTTTEGATELVTILKEQKLEMKTMPDEKTITEGNNMAKNIFGNNFHSMIAHLAKSTGLTPSNILKILGMVTPIIMGNIGSKIKNEKMSSTDLMNFFNQQKKEFQSLSIKTWEHYRLMGIKPKNNLIKGFGQDVPWKKILFFSFILFVLWFWWKSIQFKTAFN